MKKRSDQLTRDFLHFSSKNPHIWLLFERFALQAWNAGRTYYGAQGIIEQIRWHTEVVTRGGTLKLNNNYVAYYARMFIAVHPECGKRFFRNRFQISTKQPAHNVHISEWDFGPPETGHEERLNTTLADHARRLGLKSTAATARHDESQTYVKGGAI